MIAYCPKSGCSYDKPIIENVPKPPHKKKRGKNTLSFGVIRIVKSPSLTQFKVKAEVREEERRFGVKWALRLQL